MTDDHRPAAPDDDAWVEPTGGPTERAPGLADASATTYVEPSPEHRRRSFLVGGAIALSVVAIVAVLALSARANGENDEVRGEPSRVLKTETTSTTRSPASTTTSSPAPPPTSAPPPTTAPAPTAPTTPATEPPTPRATADPALPRYTPVPLPAGAAATIVGCSWQPTAGGRYEASGTLTGSRAWTVTVHWLQDGHEVGQQSVAVSPGPAGAKPWSLTHAAPTPPADPFSCALSVA